MTNLHIFSENADEDRVNMPADDLAAFAIQCHLVGFVVGAIVTTVVCWFAF
jgi:hypothetical protein